MASAAPKDEDRLVGWVREHGPAVHGFLRARLRDVALADDLLQEVFCRAWEARSRFVASGADRGYLLRIADRLSCDELRRRRRTRADLADVDPAGPDAEPHLGLARSEATQQLHAALEQLSEPQRRTLLLRYFGDMEFGEVARTLGCPLNTALSHCRRGLEALRRLLVEDHV